jgi:hypothetical protein
MWIGVRVHNELRLRGEESAVGFSRRLAILPPLAFLAPLGFASMFGSTATASDWATSTTFSNPTSVAVSYSGGVFVADTGNNRMQKVQIGPDTEPPDNGGGNNCGGGNNGVARGIDLYLTSSRKKVRVPQRLKFHQILPGWTVTETFKVKAKRSARGWVMIQADAWGKRNRNFLKLIRPRW